MPGASAGLTGVGTPTPAGGGGGGGGALGSAGGRGAPGAGGAPGRRRCPGWRRHFRPWWCAGWRGQARPWWCAGRRWRRRVRPDRFGERPGGNLVDGAVGAAEPDHKPAIVLGRSRTGARRDLADCGRPYLAVRLVGVAELHLIERGGARNAVGVQRNGLLVDACAGERHVELAHVGGQPHGGLAVVRFAAGEQLQVQPAHQDQCVGRRRLTR